MKKIFLILSVFALSFAMSCTMTKTTSTTGTTSSNNNENGRTSGDGKTPGTAIVIQPTTSMQKCTNLSITVEANTIWIFAKLEAGKSYHFETQGEGDPTLKVYKEANVANDGLTSGDPLVFDNDNAPNNSDALISFKPSTTGEYYIPIELYAGKAWDGVFIYQIK